MIDTTLKSLLSWLPYNAKIAGGIKMVSEKWFLKNYSRRSGMCYQIAITAVANQILN